MEGGKILLEINLGLGGSQTTTYIEKTKTKKQQEQVSRSEELNCFRKKGEETKKKPKRSYIRSRVKVNTNQEKETDEIIAVLVANLSLLALQLGDWAGALPPRLRLCCLFTKFLNKSFINMYSR